MFNNPSHKCIIVKYSLCLPCKYCASQSHIYISRIWVPFCMNCFTSWFLLNPWSLFHRNVFLLFSLEEEKLCLEKEYQDQPKRAVSIVGPWWAINASLGFPGNSCWFTRDTKYLKTQNKWLVKSIYFLFL